MRRIDKMINKALIIKDSMRDTIFLVMTDIMEFQTEIHLQTVAGVEVIKETHESKEEAERYIEEMRKKYRKDPSMVMIIDDIGEVSNEREENAIEADLCHRS